MKELFLIFFLGKVVLLTPNPIDINVSTELVIDKQISAITSGAGILIDVSSLVPEEDRDTIWNSDQELTDLFPKGSISAKLYSENGDIVELDFSGGYLIGKDTIELTLHADEGIPTGIKFTKVIIESETELKGVTVSWKNYKH